MDDARLRAAIDASNLGGLDASLRSALLAGATRRRVAAGSTMRGEGAGGAHLELVVDGFVRIFVSAPDGRTLTVRYARPGALLGAVSLFRPAYALPGTIQALVDADVLVIRPEVIRALAERDLQVAAAMLRELSDRVLAFVEELPGTAFATIRQRVARHLLDLASERQRGTLLVAEISQQGLADAIGSVREVVVRVLRDLRQEGLVTTGSGTIVVVDPERLYGESFAAAASASGGTQVPAS